MNYNDLLYSPTPLRGINGVRVQFPTDKFYVLCQDTEADTYYILQNKYLSSKHRKYVLGIEYPVDKSVVVINSYSARVVIGTFETPLEAKICMKKARLQKCINYAKGLSNILNDPKERIIYEAKVIEEIEVDIVNYKGEAKSIYNYLSIQAEKHPEYFI